MKYVSGIPTLNDAARKLRVSKEEVITMACAMVATKDKPLDLWNYFVQTGTIPEWLEGFLLDTLRRKKVAA